MVPNAVSWILTCRCYLKLYDSPKSTAEGDEEMSKLPPSQKKKIRRQRKAEARAKKEAESKNEESSSGGVSKSGKRNVKTADPDPHGEKLLQVEDPLSEASKYLRLLQKNSPDSLETHLLSFEVNMRKQKILLALQAVKQLVRLDAENPDSHRCLIKFFHKIGSMSSPITYAEKLVWSVLEAEGPTISQLYGRSLMETNKSFLDKHGVSLMHRAAVAEMMCVLDPSKKAEAVKLIEDSTNNVVPINGALGSVSSWKLKECIAAHQLLGTVLVDPDAAFRWKVRCAEYFPYSTYFEGKCSSAMPNSIYNQTCKKTENGSPSHREVGPNATSLVSNGKLEGFKDLTI
ncbi:N-terminal acetyltransferase A complex auxiliary subunit NAA15-like [Carica papaya]|uniref:N-terminal acetyltransferase A complex auxiliary subunit NAA15-like n=1 Tax=Carica papaya TaxID=3649 RepID=UPI000B8C7093|nr:N-terminal acetyltransferase A complex auxiliary subunit NAA15-like [Carica papaya]